MDIVWLLERLDFHDIRVLHEDERHANCFARVNAVSHMVKVAKDASYAEGLRREVAYAKLARDWYPIIVPDGYLWSANVATVASFPWLDAEWYAEQHPDRVLVKLTEDHLEDFEIVLADQLEISKRMVKGAYGDAYDAISPRDRIRRSLRLHGAETSLPQRDFDRTVDMLDRLPVVGGFQHGDFMFPNMGRQQGQFVLVDAHYSGWHVQWYDVAYLVTQTWVLFRRPKLARRILAYMLEAFAGDGIREYMAAPLLWRATVLRAVTKGKAASRAQQVWERAITGDVEQLLHKEG